MSRSYLLSLALILLGITANAQDEKLEVIRSTALPWGSPVQNIFVDTDNTKWVSNTRTIKKVIGARSSDPVTLQPGQMGLFQFPGGNADIRWQKEELTAAIGDIIDEDNYITAAFYDEVNEDIWLGTSLTGAYRLKKENGKLVFKAQWSMDNTKLRSNFVNDIAKDGPGRIWIATNDGALVGKASKWDVIERGLIIESIAVANGEVWLMGDGLVGKVGRRDRWELIDIPSGDIEGNITDIALDGSGRLWMASRIITRYDPATEAVKTFGGAEEYTSEFATHLAVDLDGAVWIGTEDKGVYVIQEGSSLVANVELVSPVTCDGNGADGALRVKVSGGAAPYNFEWSGNAEGDSPSRLSPGTYRLTITDTQGNSRLADISVPDRRVKLRAEAKAEVSEAGAADGQAEARVQGGMPPYKYAWDNGESTPMAMQLNEGAHTVTVTDRLGCEATAVVDVSRTLEALVVYIEQVKPIRCQGNKSAVLKVVAEGGAKPYTYQWSVADAPTPQLTGLRAGSYAVTVTDANGNAISATSTVEEPPAFAANAKVTQPASANGSDGQAAVTADGGKPPYTYQWASGGTTAEATGLVAGGHTVTVTDANGCKATAEVTIGEDILPLELSISEEASIDCQGAAAAALTTEVSGGKSPFAFEWSNGKTSDEVNGLTAGTYTLTVTDAAGTAVEASYTVEEPTALKARASQVTPANTGASDGAARVDVSGGVEPYTYLWTNGAATSEITSLVAGEYAVTVTDDNGCKAVAKAEITEDIAPLEVTLETASPVSCAEASDARLSATVTGGKGPFAFAWSNGSTVEGQLQSLAAGQYTLTVTDVLGTTASADIELEAPPKLKIGVEVTGEASPGQADGRAVVEASGGNGGFRYEWSTGETTAAASQLSAGMQSVTVTDAKGCNSSISVEMVEDILPLQVTLSEAIPIDCNGAATGAIVSEVNGGKAPFSYQWSGGAEAGKAEALTAGDYTLTVTDAAGTAATATFTLSEPEALSIDVLAVQPASTNAADGKARATASGGTPPYSYDWSTAVTTGLAENLPPGTHTVTVTDAKGCTTEGRVEITENILPLSVNLETAAPINCKGGAGALNAVVSGGKSPFAYAWSNGATEPQAADLAAGTYQLTLTDAAGTTIEAEALLSEPEPLSVTTAAVQPASTNNSDGIAKVAAKGGTPPYQYEWSAGASTAEAKGLAPIAHTVTVSDANGCTTEASITITENILPLQVQLEATQLISCSDASDGAIAAQITGGKPPYTLSWNDGNTSGEDRTALGPGTYKVVVTDEAGNEETAEVDLSAPEPLTAQMGRVEPAFSDTSEDGKAEVSGSGGTPPYSIAWDNGSVGTEVGNLSLGQHSVTITDTNGCTASTGFEITERVLKELTGAVRSGQTIQMQKLQFEADSSQIQESVKPLLNEIYLFLKDNSSIVVEIGGHTNNLPPDEYCDQLSTARARAVAEYMVGKGISSERVFYKGYGKRKPLFTNRTEDGRRRNQRVEIKILRL